MDNKMEKEKILIPLVIRQEEEKENVVYYGFIPGIPTNKVASLNLEVAKKNLEKEAKETIKLMLENNMQFPFYTPNEEQIKSGYDGVCFIKYIEIKK